MSGGGESVSADLAVWEQALLKRKGKAQQQEGEGEGEGEWGGEHREGKEQWRQQQLFQQEKEAVAGSLKPDAAHAPAAPVRAPATAAAPERPFTPPLVRAGSWNRGSTPAATAGILTTPAPATAAPAATAATAATAASETVFTPPLIRAGSWKRGSGRVSTWGGAGATVVPGAWGGVGAQAEAGPGRLTASLSGRLGEVLLAVEQQAQRFSTPPGAAVGFTGEGAAVVAAGGAGACAGAGSGSRGGGPWQADSVAEWAAGRGAAGCRTAGPALLHPSWYHGFH
ncbi:hypothetical protein CLOM_g21233 [Closterium sp. NIES-68]|nr:hypothetical protein CLOM_g21233 [Closterium sp. NIES-68]